MLDERFKLHRYKSSSFAGIACAFMVMGLFSKSYYMDHVFRTDLCVVILTTVVIKLGFLAWYRFND